MIIDFHTHIFPAKIAKSTVASLSERGYVKAHSDGTAEGLISLLESAGVGMAINLPVITNPDKFDSVLGYAKELSAAEYTGARIISFAGAHPAMDDIEEKLTRVKDAGILGIKIHNGYQGVYFDDPRCVNLVSLAKKFGLVVITHGGFDSGCADSPIMCTPRRVLNLLDRVGGYGKLVIAHLGGNEMFDEVYSELAGEDVYFDTGYNLPNIEESKFKMLLEKHGEDRILFASDSPWCNIGSLVELLKGYRLGAEAEEKIFSRNAIKLLGM